MTEVSKEIIDKLLELIEVAKATGKIKKGTNEVTKALERGTAKVVAVAKDASPTEVTMHIPLLAEEKGIPCIDIPTKEELGASAGIAVPTASVAVTAEGEGKGLLQEVVSAVRVKPKAAEKPEEKKEEPKTEPKTEPKEEKKEEPKEEKKEEKPAEEKPKEEKKEEPKEEKPAEEKPKEEKPEEKKEEEK